MFCSLIFQNNFLIQQLTFSFWIQPFPQTAWKCLLPVERSPLMIDLEHSCSSGGSMVSSVGEHSLMSHVMFTQVTHQVTHQVSFKFFNAFIQISLPDFYFASLVTHQADYWWLNCRVTRKRLIKAACVLVFWCVTSLCITKRRRRRNYRTTGGGRGGGGGLQLAEKLSASHHIR